MKKDVLKGIRQCFNFNVGSGACVTKKGDLEESGVRESISTQISFSIKPSAHESSQAYG